MLRSRALAYVAVVMATIGGISCGEFGPTDPAARSTGLSLPTKTVTASYTYLGGTAKGKAIRWGPSHAASEERVSTLIGPAGGSLALPGSDFTMIVPEGALPGAILITVTSKGGPHVAYDMQPHGLVFLKPVTVVQHLRNTAPYGTSDLNGIRSAYLADGQEQIEYDDSAVPTELPAGATLHYGPNGVAETHLWYLGHFSRYILISGVWVPETEEESPDPVP